MPTRQDLLASIATTTADYRAGELPAPTPEHVDRWVRQFPVESQEPILREVDHVLKKTYFSRARAEQYLKSLISTEGIAGLDPAAFWGDVTCLDGQAHGTSQRELVATFGTLLREAYGIEITDPVADPRVFLYLDDVIFSGDTLRRDLRSWIKNDAPAMASVHVVVFTLHTGFWYAKNQIKDAIQTSGKQITVTYWRAHEVKNKRDERHDAGVLWPCEIPDDEAVQQYVGGLKHPVVLRKPGGDLGPFSSEDGRQLLEREFTIAGARIRSAYQDPSDILRPLGYSRFGLGFGSMTVTYRNCPNNAPLAFWWGNAGGVGPAHFNNWYPLFPRKVHQQNPGGLYVLSV